MRIVTAILALAIAGCGNTQTRPHDPARDQCEYEAAAATQSVDRSYRSSFGQELDRAMRADKLIAMCLRAKGRK